jgi:hypothetical protein
VQPAPLAGHGGRGRGDELAVTVHSNQLVAIEALPTTETLIYTVPANKRTIVKSVIATNTNAAANTVAIEVYSGATLLGFFRLYQAAANATGDTVNMELWLVLVTGQTLKGLCSHANSTLLISGSELDI